MKLKQLRLKNSGFGGLEISHLTTIEKNGRIFGKEIREKNKQPIHLGLENKLKELRPFLLNLCKVLRGDEDKSTKDYTITETEMTGLQIVIDTTADEGTGFILEGSSTILNSKEVKFKTPKIESGDGYIDFEAVQLIIKEIVEEVKAYMSGSVTVSDEEVLVRWFEKTKEEGIDIEAIKNMSAEEQKELLSGILEKRFGCVVLDSGDLGIEGEGVVNDLIEAGSGHNEMIVEEDIINLTEETTIIPLTKVLQPELKKA